MIPVLAEAVKELDGRVSTLQADNNNLRHELDELKAELHAQQQDSARPPSSVATCGTLRDLHQSCGARLASRERRRFCRSA